MNHSQVSKLIQRISNAAIDEFPALQKAGHHMELFGRMTKDDRLAVSRAFDERRAYFAKMLRT